MTLRAIDQFKSQILERFDRLNRGIDGRINHYRSKPGAISAEQRLKYQNKYMFLKSMPILVDVIVNTRDWASIYLGHHPKENTLL